MSQEEDGSSRCLCSECVAAMAANNEGTASEVYESNGADDNDEWEDEEEGEEQDGEGGDSQWEDEDDNEEDHSVHQENETSTNLKACNRCKIGFKGEYFTCSICFRPDYAICNDCYEGGRGCNNWSHVLERKMFVNGQMYDAGDVPAAEVNHSGEEEEIIHSVEVAHWGQEEVEEQEQEEPQAIEVAHGDFLGYCGICKDGITIGDHYYNCLGCFNKKYGICTSCISRGRGCHNSEHTLQKMYVVSGQIEDISVSENIQTGSGQSREVVLEQQQREVFSPPLSPSLATPPTSPIYEASSFMASPSRSSVQIKPPKIRKLAPPLMSFQKTKVRNLAIAEGVNEMVNTVELLTLRTKKKQLSNSSNSQAALDFLKSQRPKKRFSMLGKSKEYKWHEILRGLSVAIAGKHPPTMIETLLCMAEEQGISDHPDEDDPSDDDGNGVFLHYEHKKGDVPTISSLFIIAEAAGVRETIDLFFGRVSIATIQTRLEAALQRKPPDLVHIKELLRWGSDPSLCVDEVKEICREGSTELLEILAAAPSWTNDDTLVLALRAAAERGSLRAVCCFYQRSATVPKDHDWVLSRIVAKQRTDILLAILSSRPAPSISVLDKMVGSLQDASGPQVAQLFTILLLAGASGPVTNTYAADVLQNASVSASIFNEAFAVVNADFPTIILMKAAVQIRDLGLINFVMKYASDTKCTEILQSSAFLQAFTSYDRANADFMTDLITAVDRDNLDIDDSTRIVSTACTGLAHHSAQAVNGLGDITHFISRIVVLVRILSVAPGLRWDKLRRDSLATVVQAGSSELVDLFVNDDIDADAEVAISAYQVARDTLADNHPEKAPIIKSLLTAVARRDPRALNVFLCKTVARGTLNADTTIRTLLPYTTVDYNNGQAIRDAIQAESWKVVDLLLQQKKDLSGPARLAIGEQMKSSLKSPSLSQTLGANIDIAVHVLKELVSINPEKFFPQGLLLEVITSCKDDSIATAYTSFLLGLPAPPAISVYVMEAAAKRSSPAIIELLIVKPVTDGTISAFATFASRSTGSTRQNCINAILRAPWDPKVKFGAAGTLLNVMSQERPWDRGPVLDLITAGGKVQDGSILLRQAIETNDLDAVNIIVPNIIDKASLAPALRLAEQQSQACRIRNCPCPTFKDIIREHSIKGSWADDHFKEAVFRTDIDAARKYLPLISNNSVTSAVLSELVTDKRGNFRAPDANMLTFLTENGASSRKLSEAWINAVAKLDWQTAQRYDFGNQSISDVSQAFSWIGSPLESPWSDKVKNMVEYLLAKGAQGQCVNDTFILCGKKHNLVGLEVLSKHVKTADTVDIALNAFCETYGRTPLDKKGLDTLSALFRQRRTSTVPIKLLKHAVGVRDVSALKFMMEQSTQPAQDASQILALLTSEKKGFSSDGRKVLTLCMSFTPANKEVQDAIVKCSRSYNTDALKIICQSNKIYANDALIDIVSIQDPGSVPRRETIRYLLTLIKSDDTIVHTTVTAAKALELGTIATLIECGCSVSLVVQTALSTVVAENNWLNPKGRSFINHLLQNGASGPDFEQALLQASAAADSKALDIMLADKVEPALATRTLQVLLDTVKSKVLSPEILGNIGLLLNKGVSGPTADDIATRVGQDRNKGGLGMLRQTSVWSSLIDATFTGFVSSYKEPLTRKGLQFLNSLLEDHPKLNSIQEIVVRAVECTDPAAMRSLSKNEHFSSTVQQGMESLGKRDDIFQQPNLEILTCLLNAGAEGKSVASMAFKAGKALHSDALHVYLKCHENPQPVIDAIVNGMADSGGIWLTIDGLKIMKELIEMKPSEDALMRVLKDASQRKHFDGIKLLSESVETPEAYSMALESTASGDFDWANELRIVQHMLDKGASGEVVEKTMVTAASHHHLEAVELISRAVKDSEVYYRSFSAAVFENTRWMQNLDLIAFLLKGGAKGDAVDKAFIQAGELHYMDALVLIDQYVLQTDTYSTAFMAFIKDNIHWRQHLENTQFFLSHHIDPKAIQEAIVLASAELDFSAVELIAQHVQDLASFTAAFESSLTNKDWHMQEHQNLYELFMSTGFHSEMLPTAVASAAHEQNLALVSILSGDMEDKTALNDGFIAAWNNAPDWPKTPEQLQLLHFMLEKGASGPCIEEALLSASLFFDMETVTMVAEFLHDAGTMPFDEAFLNITQNNTQWPDGWLADQNIDMIGFLLERGSHNEFVDAALVSMLQASSEGQSVADGLADLLISYHADVNYATGQSLQIAAQMGDLEMAHKLLIAGADGVTLSMGLRAGLRAGHDESFVTELLELFKSGDVLPDVNYTPESDVPIIHIGLIRYGYSPHIVQTICGLGASMSIRSPYSAYEDENIEMEEPMAPLSFALSVDACDEAIVTILQAGGNVNEILTKSKATPLMIAAKRGRSSIVELFIDKKARTVNKDKLDRTPLFYAARSGSIEAIEAILTTKPPKNDASLHEAARQLHHDAIPILVAAGHDINFPSSKHDGRNVLCELCLNADGTETERLEMTLTQLLEAKADMLRKCRGKPALFFAMENANPLPLVTKIIETCMYDTLNDQENVCKIGDYCYSPMMYLKKQQSPQPLAVAEELFDLLQSFDADDKFYDPRERASQPPDACGMPQRLLDLQRKKWIRSDRMLEEQEDHDRKMRFEEGAVSTWERLQARKHMLSLEHREDFALQKTLHANDDHGMGFGFRDVDHQQSSQHKDAVNQQRYRDMYDTAQLEDGLGWQKQNSRMLMDEQNRQARIGYEKDLQAQKQSDLLEESRIKLRAAGDQQQLKLSGQQAESDLKQETQGHDLEFKRAGINLDQDVMDAKVQNLDAMNQRREANLRSMNKEQYSLLQRKGRLEEQSRQERLQWQQNMDTNEMSKQDYMFSGQRQLMNDKVGTQQQMARIGYSQNKDRVQTQAKLGQIQSLSNQNRVDMTKQIAQVNFEERADKVEHAKALGDIANDNLQRKYEMMAEDRQDQLEFLGNKGQVEYDNSEALGQLRLSQIQDEGDARYEYAQMNSQLRVNTEQAVNQLRQGDRQNMLQSEKSKQQMMTAGAANRTQLEATKQNAMTRGTMQRSQMQTAMNRQQFAMNQQRSGLNQQQFALNQQRGGLNQQQSAMNHQRYALGQQQRANHLGY